MFTKKDNHLKSLQLGIYQPVNIGDKFLAKEEFNIDHADNLIIYKNDTLLINDIIKDNMLSLSIFRGNLKIFINSFPIILTINTFQNNIKKLKKY